MAEDQNTMSIVEETLRYIDLLKRSSERLKGRTKQANLSGEERNGLLSEIGNIEGWIKALDDHLQKIKSILWELNLPTLLFHYEKLWTTEKDNWWLGKVEMQGGEEVYTIIDATNPSHLMDLIIEDDEWSHYITQRMKEAGNRIVTPDEPSEFMPPEGWIFPPPVSAASLPTDSDDTES
jgi:hypothetical protein